jgi:hypothetical protein
MTWYYKGLEIKDIVKFYSNYISFSGLKILDSPSDVSKYTNKRIMQLNFTWNTVNVWSHNFSKSSMPCFKTSTAAGPVVWILKCIAASEG